MTSSDLKALLKRVVELVMPNLRSYYRVVRKARVVKTYDAGGTYYADVQPLRNDESEDANEPVVTKVEIPIVWAGPLRGVVCPPVEGALCDLSYYDGDPDYPRISNFRWHNMGAPGESVGGFRIQQKPGVFIRIAPDGSIFRTTDQLITDGSGETWTAVAGASSEKIPASLTLIPGDGNSLSHAVLAAGLITLNGEVVATGGIAAAGNIVSEGNISAEGTIFDEHGNTNHHSHG